MRQCPLELPVSPVLRLDQRIGRREERRCIVPIIVAKQIARPSILHVKPAGWKANNWDFQFPAAIAALGRNGLDVNPCTGVWTIAIDIKDFVIQDIDYLEGNPPDSTVSSLAMGTGKDNLRRIFIRHRLQSPPLPWMAMVLTRVDPAYLGTLVSNSPKPSTVCKAYQTRD